MQRFWIYRFYQKLKLCICTKRRTKSEDDNLIIYLCRCFIASNIDISEKEATHADVKYEL